MKKLIYFAAITIFAVGCINSSKENESPNDSLLKNDTTATIKTTNVTAIPDTLKDETSKAAMPSDIAKVEKQDEDKEAQSDEKTKPSPNAKKIDKDLRWFEHDVKQYVQAVKNGMMGSELSELWQPCNNNEKNLKKYEKEMTPEQKAKFKKYQKMLHKY